MFEEEKLLNAIPMVSLTICFLSMILCFTERAHRRVYLPLGLFFLVFGWSDLDEVMLPMLKQGFPLWATDLMQVMHFPAVLMISPLFWICVYELTAEYDRPDPGSRAIHMLPALLGGLSVVGFMTLPDTDRSVIIGRSTGGLSVAALVVLFCVQALTLVTYAQWGGYLWACWRRLLRYRARLKDLFASTESHEVVWITWMIGLCALLWLISSLSDASLLVGGAVLLGDVAKSVLNTLLVLTMSVWALRQKPGLFPERAEGLIAGAVTGAPQAKYERSALGVEQRVRIARKLRLAMEKDGLHRNPNLSLGMLSGHIGVSPNYVSQTLNEHIGETFFDFVNRWRIDDAKDQMLRQNDTVLEVAYGVGFNSRSSFYKAFKKETGQTPTAFRKTVAEAGSSGAGQGPGQGDLSIEGGRG